MYYGLSLLNAGFLAALGGSGVATFSFGALPVVQGFTVPQGITSITARAWGDGGQDATIGGTGSFVRGTFAVTAGSKVEVRIGFGASQNGGGYTMVSYPSGAGTGGFTTILVAGGGGGPGTQGYGGNAGLSGAIGGDGALAGAGGGATTGAGGAGGGGVGGGTANGGPGSFLVGGVPGIDAGGGGGAGWYGGGAGGGDNLTSTTTAGGGGGSSHVSGCTAVTNAGLNFADFYWNGAAGISGNRGRVVLTYFP